MQAHHLFLFGVLLATDPRPASTQLRLNLCFLFNTCANGNGGGGAQQETGRSDGGNARSPPPPARAVDDTWVEPVEDSKGFLYHFAHSGDGIDWSDADR